MRQVTVLLLFTVLSACGTYSAVDTMRHDSATTDMARCGGGLGIDNSVGLTIKKEAEKSGGNLSAGQSSEIFAKAMTQGLISGDGKNYDTYVKCILELDSRRQDKKTSEVMDLLHQPTLKVYLDASRPESNDRLARRLVVENTGEELTELEVTPAPFLVMKETCAIGGKSDCKGAAGLNELHLAFIPIDSYYSNVSWHGAYKGELYSVYEGSPSTFMKSVRMNRTGSMSQYVITLVRVRYKDKFQQLHERFMDITLEQRELPPELGQALYSLREESFKAGLAIDAGRVSDSVLREVWDKTSRPVAKLPIPWQQYRKLRDSV